MTAPAAARGGVHLPTGLGRWLRPLSWATLTVVVIALLALYVLPTRTWIEQRQHLSQARATLEELRAERDVLASRLDDLDDDAEIEALARSQFGLVKPGEELYAVFPAPEPPVDLPQMWPFGDVDAGASTATATPGAIVDDNQIAP